MQPKYFLLLLLLFQHTFTQAQKHHKDNGYLIYTLGKDTTVIGHYQLQKNDFVMTILVRTPIISTQPVMSVYKLAGTLYDNGEIKSAEGHNYKPIVGKDSQLIQNYKLYYQNDSTFIEQQRGSNISKQKYHGKAMIVNSLGVYPILFSPALLFHYAPAKSGDSIISNHIAVGRARQFILKRVDKKTITTYSDAMGKFTLILDRKGKLKAVDGIGSSWNLKGTVVPYLNMDSLILANAKREEQFGAIGNVLKSDSVQTTIGTTSIKINYNRPSVRSRVIFGQVVPWGRFWRTGANAATKITINQALYFDGKVLPAGQYSIFTIPQKDNWTIIFNKEANIWGTDYKSEFDVLRLPMKVGHLPESIETLTIEVVPIDDQSGSINVLWENTKASVRFSAKK